VSEHLDRQQGQLFKATLSANGDTIVGEGELSRDGTTWEGGLAISYRRIS